MSSDYISRLRAELLRAGAAQPAPRRRIRTARRVLRPLVAAAAVALLLVALVVVLPGERRDESSAQQPGDPVSLTFRCQAGDTAPEILRQRLSAAGIGASLSTDGDTVTITAPASERANVIALAAPGRFAIYDWERSVLGPDGRLAPAGPGDPGAGQSSALSEAEARARAEKRSGARALRADSGWFALRDDPALTNAAVAGAQAGKDPVNGDPTVMIDLTAAGQQAFQTLTRELAQRGADHALGGDPLQTSQHFALVLDDRIVATPYVNWREAPDGIDGAAGAQMSGFATPEQARIAAALLSTDPLPGTVQLISG